MDEEKAQAILTELKNKPSSNMMESVEQMEDLAERAAKDALNKILMEG